MLGFKREATKNHCKFYGLIFASLVRDKDNFKFNKFNNFNNVLAI